MKHLLTLLLLAAAARAGTITQVAAVLHDVSKSSETIVISGGIATGHGVIVIGEIDKTSTNCSSPGCKLVVSDSRGNTYTQVAALDNVSMNVDQMLVVGYIGNALSAGDTVTVNFRKQDSTAISGALYVFLYDVSPITPANYVVSAASNRGYSATPTAGTLTASGPNLVFAFWDHASLNTLYSAPGSGFTTITNTNDGGGGFASAQFREAQSGSITPGETLTGTVNWYGLSVALQEYPAIGVAEGASIGGGARIEP